MLVNGCRFSNVISSSLYELVLTVCSILYTTWQQCTAPIFFHLHPPPNRAIYLTSHSWCQQTLIPSSSALPTLPLLPRPRKTQHCQLAQIYSSKSPSMKLNLISIFAMCAFVWSAATHPSLIRSTSYGGYAVLPIWTEDFGVSYLVNGMSVSTHHLHLQLILALQSASAATIRRSRSFSTLHRPTRSSIRTASTSPMKSQRESVWRGRDTMLSPRQLPNSLVAHLVSRMKRVGERLRGHVSQLRTPSVFNKSFIC